MDNSQQIIGSSDSNVMEDNHPHPIPLVESLQELWILAKIASNHNPDPIIAAIMALGLNPTKIEGIGYEFIYQNMNVLYLSGHDKSLIRFAIPKIELITASNAEMITQVVNSVNSLVPGSKISIISNEVWAIYEHFSVGNEDYAVLVERILSQLSAAVTLFRTTRKEKF